MKNNILPEKIFGMDRRIFILWLEPLGLLMGLLLSVFLVIIPKVNEVLARVTEIKNVSKKTTEVNQKISYLQTMNQEEIRSNATKLASGLLPEKSAYLLLKVIKNAATTVNYNIEDFSISMGDVKAEDNEDKKNTSYDKIPIEINLIGPSENYLKLAKTIERSLPIMSINKFEMTSSRSGASTIKLSVSAYYLRDISDLKLEALTLADLTLSQAEANLLETIGEYSELEVERIDDSGTFIKYQRDDPFFTP